MRQKADVKFFSKDFIITNDIILIFDKHAVPGDEGMLMEKACVADSLLMERIIKPKPAGFSPEIFLVIILVKSRNLCSQTSVTKGAEWDGAGVLMCSKVTWLFTIVKFLRG